MGVQMTTHLVDVYRLALSSSKESYGGTAVITGLDVGIFPAGNDIVAIYGGESAYQLYEVYVYESAVLKNGDKLKSGTDEWIIQGVPQVFSTPYLSYQRLLCEKVV
jgi:hypothetical protein